MLMTSLRCLVLLVILCWTGIASAQQAVPDERAARVTERYKSMLLANPAEGLALDRLWKSYDERSASGSLVDEFRALAEAPGATMPPVLIYGHLLKRAGRLDEAAAFYEHAETLDPASPLPTLARAEMALVRSQPEAAAGLFARATEKIPAGDRRQSEIALKLGAAWMSAGQPLKAAETWERIVAHNPANLGLRRQLAENYERNGLLERALEHYNYLETHAEPAERAAVMRDLSRLHEARGDLDAARDALERGLTLTARDNWLHRELETRLIRLYQRANRVPELAARWRSAAQSAPRDPEAWRRLEALAEAQGDPAGEREALERLVDLAPGGTDDALKLAHRLADDGDRTRAAALYDGLLKIRPDDLDLIFARAELDLQFGQPTAAVERIEARVARNSADESVSTPALAFFLEHHLDAAAEKILRAEVARQLAADEPALALGKFLFAQRKVAAARAVLVALGNRPGNPAMSSARWLQAAEVFREQNLASDALYAWQEAARLQPESPAPLLAAGEFLLGRGDKPAAAERFEHASEITPPGPEQVDAEHRWFGVLQSMEDPGVGQLRVAGSIPAAPGDPGTVRVGPSLDRHLAALEKMASDAPTADHLLRLARWQAWAHLSELALASATRAVALNPASIPARELIVSAATDLHRPAEAETQLAELAERDPARRNDYGRQLANLKMDEGDLEAAVAGFSQLQQTNPASREALTDLALVQQRADRWYDALGTWERAYALPGSTPAQRDEIRRPLLAACERLSQFARAAEILRAAIDAQADLTTKIDLFHELAAFWHRHDLGPALREDYEKRVAARPDDYFGLTALADLRREDGREREAFALWQRAYYASPDPPRSLRELVGQAEQLGDDAEAVAQQRRLVALPNQATAANLEKLAALEDADFDDSAATATWTLAVAKFPRDTTLLGHAADYFEKADHADRARELLRQLVAVDGTDASRLLRLGRLEAQAGDRAGAQGHFEQLLSHTAPETADDPLSVPTEMESRGEPAASFRLRTAVFPLPPRPSTGPGIPVALETGERRLRLQAIEDLSRLLFPDGPGASATLDDPQKSWLRRWQSADAAGAKSEPLAAFYFSGQTDLTLGLLAGLTARTDSTGDLALGAFLNAGLRLGGYRQLADWAWRGADRAGTAARGQRLLGTLQTFLRTGGKPRARMIAELFPAEVRAQETLWTAAQNGFAGSHWYVQAAELGERVLARATSNRAGYAVEVAEWEILSGNPVRAREALRQALDDPNANAHELDAPLFLALRSYYLLLPETERAAFVAQRLGRRGLQDGSARAVLEGALLHGFSGADEAARRDLNQLLAMRLLSSTPLELSPDSRRWTYLLTCGDQLRRWNLDSLAIHLWRHALEEAGAFDRQGSDTDGTVQEIRHRLLSTEVATASDPQLAREKIAEFLQDQTEPSVINSVAVELWNDGRREAAAQLYEALYRLDPKGTDYWPNLYRFDEAHDPDAAERLLGDLLAEARPLPPGVGRAELVGDLAVLLEKRGDVPGAFRLLERARQAMPGTLAVLLQLAQLDERADRWDDAVSIWREGLALDPGHSARLGLAAAEEHRGNRGGAIEVLRGGLKDGPDPGRVELAIRLVQTLLADHRADEARQLAADLLNKGQVEAIPAIGAAFTANGEPTVAEELLSDAVLRTHDPAARFHLQQAVVEQGGTPGTDAADFARQMRRLGKFAQASAALRTEYDDLLYPLAHQRGADAWLEGELQRAWQHGQGDPTAGARLAGLYLQAHREDALRDVVRAIDRRADLPEDLLYRLATSLVESDHAPLALALCERLASRFPQKQEYQLERAEALWKSDRRQEATRCLTDFAALAIFRDEVLVPIAEFYFRHGEKSLGSQYLSRIVKTDPSAVRSPQSWMQLAQIALDENRVRNAGQLFRVVYARPEADDLGPLVRYLRASGQLEGGRALGMPAPGFPLSFERRARLLVAVRDELVRTGRADDGRRLIEAHAEFLAATPAVATELAREVNPASVRAVVGCLERAADQRAPVSKELKHALAGVYAQWAAWDSDDPSAGDDAFAHLSRAFALEPDNAVVAGQLATLCMKRMQPDQAAEILAAFLSPDALPSEREKARQILATP